MRFYESRDLSPFIWDSDREILAAKNVRILSIDEADRLMPLDLFTSVRVSEHSYLALPRVERINIPISYEPEEHHEAKIDGVTVQNIVEPYVNGNFVGCKFLLSVRPDVYLGLAFEWFDYAILWAIYSGHMTTPFILFDESLARLLFMDFDFGFITLSLDSSLSQEKLLGKDRQFLVDYFNANFVREMSYGQYHEEQVRNHYAAVIKGINI